MHRTCKVTIITVIKQMIKVYKRTESGEGIITKEGNFEKRENNTKNAKNAKSKWHSAKKKQRKLMNELNLHRSWLFQCFTVYRFAMCVIYIYNFFFLSAFLSPVHVYGNSTLVEYCSIPFDILQEFSHHHFSSSNTKMCFFFC